jgi:hypothetical protein
MNLGIPEAILGSLVGGGITGLVVWAKITHESSKAVAVITTEVARIDKAREICRQGHDKYDSLVSKHHEDTDVHVSSAWRDEVRSRLGRIEAIQDKVLNRLLESA